MRRMFLVAWLTIGCTGSAELKCSDVVVRKFEHNIYTCPDVRQVARIDGDFIVCACTEFK